MDSSVKKALLRSSWSAVIAIGFLVPHCSAQSYFSNRTSFIGGEYPVAAVAADFNGDGKLDLAVVNRGDNTVSILLGKPDSTFTPKVDYAVGAEPTEIVAADIDGDKKVDLAVLNSESKTVSILLGHGDGTFAAQTVEPTDDAPVGIVASDFNGDGKIDLAVACSTPITGAVDILLGNGDGTFASQIPAAVDAFPTTLAGGDFNGDGRVDLMTVNVDQEATVLLSNNDGTFSNHRTSFAQFGGDVTVNLALGDFDADGMLDGLVWISGYWDFLRGLGNGQFKVSPDFQMAAAGFAGYGSPFVVADFNRDGKPDLASANTIMLGNGSGTGFREAPFPCKAVKPLLSADFNGDGVPDLVFVNGLSGVLVLLGNGDGTFGQTPDYTLSGLPDPVSSNSLGTAVAGDFNGDGKQDVAVFGIGVNPPSAIVTGLGKGDGTFKAPVSSPIPTAVDVTPVLADFDSDGKLDIATWSMIIGQTTVTQFLSIFHGNGDGTFQAPNQIASPPNVGTPTLAAGDFDSDHKPDLAVITERSDGSSIAAYVQILLAKSGFTSGAAISLEPSPPNNQIGYFTSQGNFMRAADLNHDGKIDLAVANANVLAVLLGDGDGTFQNPSFYGCGGQIGCFDIFAMGDFDGDGKLDIVGSGSEGLSVFQGNGGGTFQPKIFTPFPLGLAVARSPADFNVGDFNHDGKLDVAFGVAVAMGKGDGTFQAPIFNGYSPAATLMGDFNSDGVPDMFIVNQPQGPIPFLNGLLSAPQISLYPQALAFSPVEIGAASLPQDLTVTNIGNMPLSIRNVAVSSGYTQTNTCGEAIAAGAQCVVSITFAPDAGGDQAGSLTITDNLATSPQRVMVSGVGVATSVFLSPDSMTFTAQPLAVTSSSQAVTLNNTGNVSLAISSIATEGDFAQTNNCGTRIAAGSSCKINVTFTPTASGLRSGELKVTDDSPTSPQSITLTGSGPDFNLAPPSGASTTSSIAAGQSATYDLNVTGVAGFNQPVTLNCTGAPAKAACTVSPASATPGSAPSSVRVTVVTTAPSVLAPRSRPRTPTLLVLPRLQPPFVVAVALAIMIWGIVRDRRPRKTTWPTAWGGLFAGLLLVLALAGCGGGSSSGGPAPPTNPGTPAGSYTLTVTGTAGSGSSALSRSVSLTLKVS